MSEILSVKSDENAENELDRLSDVYDNSNYFALENRLMMEHYASILEALYKDQDKSCLDLGIGLGVTPVVFSKLFKKYTIVEGSQVIIDRLKSDYGEIGAEIICSYFEDFETDKKYDVIIMGFVLEHVDDPRKILKRFNRFLENDGQIFIVLPNYAQLNRRIGQMMGLIETTKFFTDNDKKLGHKTLFDVESIKALISSAGLYIHRIEGIYMKPITTEQIKLLGLGEDFLRALVAVGKDYPELSAAIIAICGKNEGE